MKWQPIETAPNDGKLVIMYTPDPPLIWMGPSKPIRKWQQKRAIPTHWMPLPEPPKDSQ